MNERIKELVEQAGFIYFQSDEDSNTPIDWSCDYTEELEKFAELIIKECAKQSMLIGRYHDINGITPDLAIAIAVGLKKHFGVE